ncbi:MAG: CvpA family protein [Campylobacterota bacterium]|nr:CvpA family protein [Campylobacterota bacterium]
MDFNYFDLIAGITIILLGLKGILNGFFKELFGLIGIIGGIFVASRYGNEAGLFLNDLIFKFDNDTAINFTGFLVTLSVFWLVMIALGHIFKKLSSMSGLGPIDRIFGFIFGASKFFLIAAVIAYSAYNVKAVKSTIDETMKTSILFPIFVETGGFIMKLEPVKTNETINDTIDEQTKNIDESIKSTTQDIIDETKKKLIEKMPEQMKGE